MARPMPTAAALAAGVGFVSLSWEILWYRIHAFATGGTMSVFGVFLGIYLAGVAVGSLLARHACETGARNSERIAGAASLAALCGGIVGYVHAPLAAWVGQHAVAMLALPVAALSAACYGAVFPLLAHHAVPPDERVGRGISYLYLANILGAAFGAALTGFVFLHVFGTAASAGLLLVVSSTLAVGLRYGVAAGRAGKSPAFAAAAVVAAAGLVALSGPLYGSLWERLLWKSPAAAEHPFAAVVETRAGVVAVTADGTVYGNGAYDGRLNVGLDDDTNGIWRIYGLAGVHPRARRVAMLGLGSGAWAQVIAHLPSVEELVVVEINSGYIELLRRHELVRGLLTNPAVRIVVDDGRRWLQAQRTRFDAIVINTTFHWRANVTHLLSAEFHALARSRLAPDGVLYFNTTWSAAAMYTACRSFAYGLRFGSYMAVGNAEVAMDAAAFEGSVRHVAIDGQPAVADADAWAKGRLPILLAPDNIEPCPNILERASGAPMITDDNMASEVSVPWHATYKPALPE